MTDNDKPNGRSCKPRVSDAEQIRLLFEEMANVIVDAALKIVDAKKSQAEAMSTKLFLYSQQRPKSGGEVNDE